MVRNLYDDGIWDVYSINDLEGLKQNGTMNVLAKTHDYLMIEAGKDFWRVDFLSGEVFQYKDFVSLRDNIDAKKVYSKNNPIQNQDYGAVLYDTILNTEIKDLPNFSLQERQDYFEGTTKDVVKYYMKGELERSVKKNQHTSKEISSTLAETLNKSDTKVLHDAIQVAMEVLALFYSVFSHQYKIHKKQELIKDILDRLDKGELDIKEVLSDRILNERVPELRLILDEWQKNIRKMKVETSTTFDEAFEKQQSQKQNQETIPLLTTSTNYLLPSHNQEVKLLVEKLVDDPKMNEVAQKLAENSHFHNLRAEQFCKRLDIDLQNRLGDSFKQKLQDAFEKLGEKYPIDFIEKYFSDTDILDELKFQNPNISGKDTSLAIAYLNYIIEKGNSQSKQIISEKITENAFKKETIPHVNIISTMVQKILERVEKVLKNQYQNTLFS